MDCFKSIIFILKDGGSVDIKIWDAHFTTEELPQGFKVGIIYS